VIFSGEAFKVFKCYNFLPVQRGHNCSPAASFANCVMTLYLSKSASANVSFYTNNSKMPNFLVMTLLSQMSDVGNGDTAPYILHFGPRWEWLVSLTPCPV